MCGFSFCPAENSSVCSTSQVLQVLLCVDASPPPPPLPLDEHFQINCVIFFWSEVQGLYYIFWPMIRTVLPWGWNAAFFVFSLFCSRKLFSFGFFWILRGPKAPVQGWGGSRIWSLTPDILKWKHMWLQSSCIETAKSRTFLSVPPCTGLKLENLLLLKVFCGYFLVFWHFLKPSFIEYATEQPHIPPASTRKVL